MKTKSFIVSFIGATLFAHVALATIPEVLIGGWMIDAVATAENLKNSPKWDEKNAKVMPIILNRMSSVVCTFDAGTMTVSDGEKKDTLTVELQNSEARLYVLAGKSGDDEVTIRATFTEEGLLNIRSSTTDDMDYFLWKRTPEGFVPQKMKIPAGVLESKKKTTSATEKQPAS